MCLVKMLTKLEFCENCVLGKQHRLSFRLSNHRSKSVLDYIHYDLWGPTKVQTKVEIDTFFQLWMIILERFRFIC